MKLLLVVYAALLVDLLTGLQLNLYGWGREPLLFAMGAVVAAGVLYTQGQRCIAMIVLILCCAWLLMYPAKNGFDVVLSPTLFLGVAWWIWQKLNKKK